MNTERKPRPEDFGYMPEGCFDENGDVGWAFEGGEEAYEKALEEWEKNNHKEEE